MTESPAQPPGWMFKVLKESGISLSGSLVGTVLNYAVLATVTRYLAPAQYGTFAIAQSVIAVATVVALCGTPMALDRFIPRYVARNDDGSIRSLLVGVLKLVSWTVLVVAGVLLVFSRFLALRLFDDPDLARVLSMMVISIPALAWIELVVMAFTGHKELRYRVYLHQLALPIFKVVFAVAVLSLGFGLVGWVWAYIAALVAASLLAAHFFRTRMWAKLRDVPATRVDLREVVSYAWPLSVNGLVFLMSGHIGVLMLGALRPEADVGVYRVYIYVILVLSLVKVSFTRIYKPIAAGLVSTGDSSGIRQLHLRVSKWMLITGSFLGLLILLLGEDLLGVLVPTSYRVSGSALLVLVAARTLSAVLGPQSVTLEAFGNTRLSLLNGLLMIAVNVSAGLLLIPKHGVLGAAGALGLALVVHTAAELVEVYLLHRLHPFSRAYLTSSAIVVAAGVAAFYAGNAFEMETVPRVLVTALVLTVVFLVGLRVSGSLDRDDYAVVGRLLARLSARG